MIRYFFAGVGLTSVVACGVIGLIVATDSDTWPYRLLGIGLVAVAIGILAAAFGPVDPCTFCTDNEDVHG